MTNANKAKGSKWELDLRRYFADERGLRLSRPWQEGHEDAGDMHIEELFAGQAKNYRSWEDAMRIGLDGAIKQAQVAGLPYAVALVKRARRPVGNGYAVMEIEQLASIAHILGNP